MCPSEAGFDSPAKLASRLRMEVLPHFGGYSRISFLPTLDSGHCTTPSDRHKYNKKLSRSKRGLQNCLYMLSSYCSLWMLSINSKKKKIMILEKRAKKYTESSFHIDNEIIEIVQNYIYLGTLISSTCNFLMALDPLKERALHALFQSKKTYKYQ